MNSPSGWTVQSKEALEASGATFLSADEIQQRFGVEADSVFAQRVLPVEGETPLIPLEPDQHIAFHLGSDGRVASIAIYTPQEANG